MKTAKHEEAVQMLTNSLSYITLVVYRDRVIKKGMTPLSKLQDPVASRIKEHQVNVVFFGPADCQLMSGLKAKSFTRQVAHGAGA